MKNNKAITHTPKELFEELQALASEAKTLMTDAVSENSAAALENLQDRFDATREKLSDLYTVGRKKVIAGAKYTDETIRENPYQSIAIAAGVGLLVGVLLGRRSK